ncbi:Arylsulfatase [Symmachiella dynata]|uniref:sulfatase family protein n=1 Tax=Symmachiella dynata TaxID=2527995 RepID=UPI00118B9C2C|nr:sulfatase-like hydrolase/transferase [Symmachiella dynata]QDT46905.1 Arylsulfatase [Symmachiella dynata]
MPNPVSRRSFLQQSAVTTGALAAAGELPAADQKPSRRPNVLFIMTDQQRYDCVAANGNGIIKTPHLDALAAQSANFSRAFVQAPVCVPARASFFTGRYAHAHRNRVNYTPIDRRTVLLPARLREAGFQTALIGKLHLFYYHPPSSENAQKTGFDIVELHDGTHRTDRWSDYARWRNKHDPRRDVYYRELAKDVPDLAANLKPGTNPYRSAIDEQFTDTTWTGDRTRAALRQMAKADQPFFLYSSFWKPHSPFEVPVPFDSLYNDVDFELPRPESLEDIERLPLPLQKLILRGNKPPYDMDRAKLNWIYRSYYASITHIDREVGRILQTLKETGQAENTIVVFASDHGDQLLEHGLMGKNVFFEASVRVPLMLRLPGRIQPGQYDELVETIDVLPTLMELCGLPIPEDCHGRSLSPLIAEKAGDYTPRDAVHSENIIPEVITGGSLDFEFVPGQGIKGIRHPDAKMIRTDRWKYNYYPEGFAELYDLKNDPHEQHNLANDPARAVTVAELKGRILDWLITATETDQIAKKWMV